MDVTQLHGVLILPKRAVVAASRNRFGGSSRRGVMPKYLPRRKARSEPDGALATHDLVESRPMQSLGELIGGNSHGLDELGTQDFSGAGCHRLFVRPWEMSQLNYVVPTGLGLVLALCSGIHVPGYDCAPKGWAIFLCRAFGKPRSSVA